MNDSNVLKGRNSKDANIGGELVAFINHSSSEYPVEVGAAFFAPVNVQEQKDLDLNVAKEHAKEEYNRIMEMVAILQEQAKKLARELSNIAKSISELADLATVIVDFAKKVRAMIDYINSLPAKLYNLLKQCLSELLASLTSGLSDLFSLGGTTDFSEAIAAFKDVKTAAAEIYTA